MFGAAFVSISGMSSKGTRWRTNQLVYVAKGLDQLILSKEACKSLGLIERNFPTIGSYGRAKINTHTYSGGVEGVEAHVDVAGNLLPAKEVMQVEKDLITPCGVHAKARWYMHLPTEGTATNMPARKVIRPAKEDNQQPLLCLFI